MYNRFPDRIQHPTPTNINAEKGTVMRLADRSVMVKSSENVRLCLIRTALPVGNIGRSLYMCVNSPMKIINVHQPFKKSIYTYKTPKSELSSDFRINAALTFNQLLQEKRRE